MNKIMPIILLIIVTLIACSISVFASDYDYAKGLENSNNVWINVTLVANVAKQVYYSNVSGTYTANPNKVFLLYDDFDGASLNNTKWGNASGIVQLSGVVNISGANNANLIYSNAGWQMSDSSNLGIFMLARGMGATTGYTQMELSVGNTISASATGTNGSGIFLSHDAGANLNNIYANWNAYGETGNSGWTASGVDAGELNLMGIWLRGDNASHYRGASYSYNKTTTNKYGGLMKAKMGYAGSYDWVEVVYRNAVEPTIVCGGGVCNITSTINLTGYQVSLPLSLGGNLNVSDYVVVSTTYSVRGIISLSGVVFPNATVVLLTNTSCIAYTTTNSTGGYNFSGVSNGVQYSVFAQFFNSTVKYTATGFVNASMTAD